jgi:hypothetical protein
MTLRRSWLLAWLCAVAPAAHAQTVRVGLQAVGVTYSEIDEARRAEGGGAGATLSLRWRRFYLDATGFTVKLDPKGAAGGTSFDLRQVDVRVSYAFVPGIAIELGGGRRTVDPEFATQDVGVVRLGVLSQVPLNRLSAVWARGAYLVDSRFNGGGSADLAVELGLGVGVGTPNGRFRARADFEFQRIDRTVAGAGVPLQMAAGRLGVEVGF